jgi:hypothetical protein
VQFPDSCGQDGLQRISAQTAVSPFGICPNPCGMRPVTPYRAVNPCGVRPVRDAPDRAVNPCGVRPACPYRSENPCGVRPVTPYRAVSPCGMRPACPLTGPHAGCAPRAPTGRKTHAGCPVQVGMIAEQPRVWKVLTGFLCHLLVLPILSTKTPSDRLCLGVVYAVRAVIIGLVSSPMTRRGPIMKPKRYSLRERGTAR